MSNNGFRLVALNGVLVILVGLLLAGFPLVWVVVREVYGQAVPVALPGDYRGWMMAHLEGLLNGLMIIALAAVTRFRPLGPRRERWLVVALIVTAWGNLIPSMLAPLFGVRAMTFDASVANNILCAGFYVAFIATLTAFGIVTNHLWRKSSEIDQR